MKLLMPENIKLESAINLMKNNKLIIYFIVISILKIFLVSKQKLFIFWSPFDDNLFLNIAESILNGQWLGQYNNATFVKGVGYPLWIALAKITSINLIISQHILYLFSTFLFVRSFQPLINKKWIGYVLALLLIFNPITFSDQVGNRVIRDYFYTSLVIIIFSLTIKISTDYISAGLTKKVISILLGLTLSLFFITREEGFWILPSLFFIFIATTIYIKNFKIRLKGYFISVILLPLMTIFITFSIISLLNHYFYGVWYLNELKSSNFSRAYGALQRANPSPVIRVELPKKNRENLYQVSPAFSEIKEILEAKQKYWFMGGEEIKDGFFLWGFRDAVQEKGYFSSAKSANEYFERVATEVNAACNAGKIVCLDNSSFPLSPTLQLKDIYIYIHRWGKALGYVVTFEGINSESSYAFVGSGGSLFERMTGEIVEQISPQPPKRNIYNTLMDFIGELYHYLMPMLFVISMLTLLISAFTASRKRYIYWIILSIFSLFLSRTLLVSLVDVILFNGISTLYLASAYPFFIAVSVVIFDLFGTQKI